jgi:hypothetical protein
MYLCASGIVVACDWFQQSHKYMTDRRPERFNNHTNTWPITGHNDSTITQIHGIVVACDWSCICVLVESLWPVVGHAFVWLLNRCDLWSGMYLFDYWQIHDRSQATTIQLAHKYMPDHRPQRFNNHTNTWPIVGHNDSTITQIHDRSQATTIQQSHKYMTDHKPQRFNNHTNTWPTCWIVVDCDPSCICVLVESLWPVIGHVFVWLLNRCGLWSVMYLCDCHAISQTTTIPLAQKYTTDHRPQRFH